VSKRRVTVLGSTGSIGTQGLEVIAQHQNDFEVVALASGENFTLLAEQISKFKPKKVSVSSDKAAEGLRKIIGTDPVEILVG